MGQTYLLVDGENIDTVLGLSVLGRKPAPEERPRWDKVLSFLRDLWQQPVKPLFFLNASSGQLPMPFISALMAMGFRPIPLIGSGADGEKVVDLAIQRTLEALEGRPGDVVLASHDADFIPQVTALLAAGRRVALLAFREFINTKLAGLTSEGLRIYDLELDTKAFTSPLPRVRAIPLAEFNPLDYL